MARILIADDAAFMRMMIKSILTENGHTVVGEAANGQEAVEMYQQLKPDLVTMDVTMPVMDGLQAVQCIRAIDPNAIVVMCSAMGQQSMIIDAVRFGAKDFIIKPFDKNKVIETVSKLTRKS